MAPYGNIPYPKVRAWQIAIGALVIVLALVPSSALPAQARHAYIRHPELIEGPWEFATPYGPYGIFFQIDTHWREQAGIASSCPSCPSRGWCCNGKTFVREPANPRTIIQQTISLLCYRPGYAPLYSGDYSRSLFGNRFILGCWGKLDIIFHPEARKWTGTWSYRGVIRSVVLTRPHPARGVQPNPFVGDWVGVQSKKSVGSSSSLHITESSGGALTAWLDRKSSGFDCRSHSIETFQGSGGLLHVFSAERVRISIGTTQILGLGPPFRYMGRLSEGGTEILGAWSSHDGVHFGAPGDFRRVP